MAISQRQGPLFYFPTLVYLHCKASSLTFKTAAINEAPSIPAFPLLPSETIASSSPFLLVSTTCRPASAQEYCGQEKAGYSCPHEAEVVFAECSSQCVLVEIIAAYDIRSAVQKSIPSVLHQFMWASGT